MVFCLLWTTTEGIGSGARPSEAEFEKLQKAPMVEHWKVMESSSSNWLIQMASSWNAKTTKTWQVKFKAINFQRLVLKYQIKEVDEKGNC